MTQAETLRDLGLVRVITNSGEWALEAHRCIRRLPKGWSGQGEDIRAIVEPLIGAPHSNKVWGAIVNLAIKDGILKGTGEYRKTKSPKTHAHPTQVYVRT